MRHLQNIHQVKPPKESTEKRSSLESKHTSNVSEEIIRSGSSGSSINQDDDTILVNNNIKSSSSSKSRKRCRISNKCGSDSDRECNYEKTEKIHQALASLIAMNQLPLSFCSSPGFFKFMAVVEPNYKICSDQAMKKRLHALKSNVEDKIKNELQNVKRVVCTTDGWSSMAQNSYISLTAHIIDNQWLSKSFTLATKEMTERYTAVNLAEKLICIFDDWEINGKVTTVITDNAKNIVNAVQLLPITIDNENMDVTCAAHNLQLAINIVLKQEIFSEKQCTNLVGHFKHSNVAKQSLLNKQEQLGLPHQSLVQCCKTRWNSIYLMLDRLSKNRSPISNVLADRAITSLFIAQKLEITESQWLRIENLVNLLKPLYVITNLFCSENYSPVSMVRPLLSKLLDHHLKHYETDDQYITEFKSTIIFEIKERFKLDCSETNSVSVRQIASFLDPRYKELEFEPIATREKIRKAVKSLLEKFNSSMQNIEFNMEQNPLAQSSDLQFLYGNTIIKNDNLTTQFQIYTAEPQLRFDLNPYEWWKSREIKYPNLAALAKEYLAIPATSVSSERCFSTAGNIVTSKRTCLLAKNVNMLTFLYQNRKLLV
ncbi:E3 SUMO-protein ligase ZBED1-like [Daktulosphaira vitifoliae]|uniref:E3 SUMO-protein ligase ZBED1-like n=1 Tax=Daktulosphaira vitifoliae TaxID=58002 RepID=UPI0021A9A2F0|nr:E3 SUMO-protein ligase ZBED1-like [Daktulosphaira vitifoliae]